jgi:hypothetical protein
VGEDVKAREEICRISREEGKLCILLCESAPDFLMTACEALGDYLRDHRASPPDHLRQHCLSFLAFITIDN